MRYAVVELTRPHLGDCRVWARRDTLERALEIRDHLAAAVESEGAGWKPLAVATLEWGRPVTIVTRPTVEVE